MQTNKTDIIDIIEESINDFLRKYCELGPGKFVSIQLLNGALISFMSTKDPKLFEYFTTNHFNFASLQGVEKIFDTECIKGDKAYFRVVGYSGITLKTYPH